MCDNRSFAKSLRQMDTPLNSLFFSEQNINLLQGAIRQDFRDKTGIAIDRQNRDDLVALMRSEFINTSGDHYNNVEGQVRDVNARVLRKAFDMISVGVSQFIGFMKDTATTVAPNELPKSTTTYGSKLGSQDFGI